MVLGIAASATLFLSLFVYFGVFVVLLIPIASACAVLLGHISRSKVDGLPGFKSASSKAGLITGYVNLGIFLPLFGLAYLINLYV
jgi:hypothetical protein